MSYLEHREKKNIERIKKEIFLKNSNNPYYVNQTVYSVRNEYDQFPYPHWYKGVAESEKPIIADREAGWIPKRHKEPIKKEKDPLTLTIDCKSVRIQTTPVAQPWLATAVESAQAQLIAIQTIISSDPVSHHQCSKCIKVKAFIDQAREALTEQNLQYE